MLNTHLRNLFLFRFMLAFVFLSGLFLVWDTSSVNAAEALYSNSIDDITVTLNSDQTKADMSAIGTTGCPPICATGQCGECPDGTNTSITTPVFGWVQKTDVTPVQVIVGPDTNIMGQELFNEQPNPYNWEYNRPGIDISTWPNGSYQFCATTFGDLKKPLPPYFSGSLNEKTRCTNFSITSHAGPSYTLTLEPYREMLEGSSTSYLISVQCKGGFSGAVSNFGFAPQGNPFNDKVSFVFPQNISCAQGKGFLTVSSGAGSSPLSPPSAPFVNPQFTITSSAPSVTSQIASASLRIYALPKITSFSATPTQVFQGQSSVLAWGSSSTLSCQASGDWSGPKPVASSGESSGVLLRLNPEHSFALTCSGALGSSVVAYAVVKVVPQPSTLHINYSLDGKVFETSNLTLNYSISGPTAVPSSAYTIARDHGSLSAGTYKLNLEKAPEGYVFNSTTPSTINLASGSTQTFTINFSSPSCPSSPQAFLIADSKLKAGDEKTISIPAGYSGGTIQSSDSSIAAVSQNGNSFTLKGLKGGQVVLTGTGWTYSGVSCQPAPLNLNVEGFTVTLSPAFTQIKQGDSVNSLLVTVGGSFWQGSQVSLALPEITSSSATPISLSQGIKLCRISNPSDCVIPLVTTTGNNQAIISFTTSSSVQTGTYQVLVAGKFSNGYSVTGSGLLSVVSGSGGGGSGSNPTPTPTPTPTPNPTLTTPTRTPQVRFDGSDKQIAKINNQTNNLGSGACLGRTAGIDSDKGRLKMGDVLRFKVNICNTGTLDVTPSASTPLVITDTFTNFKIPNSGLNFKLNGQACNSSNNCSLSVNNSQIVATITGGTLKSGNFIWNLEYDLLIGVPAGFSSDLIIANNRGIISYGTLQYPYNTGSLVAAVDFKNVPKQYEIAP